MNETTSNKSKGCFGWLSGIGAAILGLLTATASCAGILQHFESSRTRRALPTTQQEFVINSAPEVVNQVVISSISAT